MIYKGNCRCGQLYLSETYGGYDTMCNLTGKMCPCTFWDDDKDEYVVTDEKVCKKHSESADNRKQNSGKSMIMENNNEYKQTWLDQMLIKDCDLSEQDVREMQPCEKFKMWLNLNDIYGYEEDILRTINAAYGTDLK